MSNYRRADTSGATYFFTVVTYRRQNILFHDDIRAALRQAIHKTREQHPFSIDAWVLLPDHLHAIWTLPANDADFSKRWSLIKRHVSQACPQFNREDWLNESQIKRQESTLWQRRFWEHQIRDERDFQTHMDYIHHNPVKHGLVQQAIDWPYSTLHRYIAQGVYPADWASEMQDNADTKFGE
jgi:putative transposase